MRTRLISKLAAAPMAVALMLAATPAQAVPVAATWGGGRAVVTNEEGFLPPGVVTQFGLNATIDDSGSAQGHFACWVHPGGGGLSAQITGGIDLGDGCVILTGTSTCVFPGPGGGVFFGEPITLMVMSGGPGEGGFVLSFDNFPEVGGDAETVHSGVIKYHTPE